MQIARNTSLVPSGANGIIALSPSTSDWINGSVTVTATTTQTGYNLQTSTNGSDWGKTNPLTFSANGTAYARLWDGYNGGTAASTAITNIDKTAPTISSFKAGTVTTSSIPVTVSASDSASGIKSYAFYLNDKLITTQTSPTYTYTGLTAATSYKIKVAVTDNAGNTAEKNIETESVADAIKNNSLSVGDTITYIPPTGQTYTVAKENSGYSSDQTFTTENSSMTTWKVWKIDKTNNTIEIVSASATGTNFYLTGATGYNQGPGIMNNICKALYSRNNDITARSLDQLDIEEAMAENWGIERGTDAFNKKIKSLANLYGKTYTPDYNYVPKCYTTADITTQQDSDIRPGSSSATGFWRPSGLKFKVTTLGFDLEDTAETIGSERSSIITTKRWIASRSVYGWESGLRFNLIRTSGHNYSYVTLFGSYRDPEEGNGLSPLASLNSSVRLDSAGASAWTVK